MSNESENKPTHFQKYKKLYLGLALLLLLVLLIYFFTYFFANKNKKVIYQDTQRRIYLTEKKEYKKGREMWRMVYEDQKTGNRFFILGNSKKGFSDKAMAKIVINTIDQGKTKSFDQVEGAGITMRKATTDIHSNLIDKKGIGDLFPSSETLELNF